MSANDRVFDGKTALLYGAAAGIGRAVALEFARRGAAVAIADLQLPGAQETARLITEAGGRSTAICCDVTSDAAVREAAVQAEIALGPADIVMNNVGGILHGNPEDIPISEWQRVSCLIPGPVMTNVAEGMKTWSAGVEMRGPGAKLAIQPVEEVAVTLADGMQAGRILIPTHAEIWDTLTRRAADPDRFIRDQAAAFARGDHGRPSLPLAGASG